tara:strand:- start:419 stop:577 length:159 start_codon:yes stop_codon:yes gene_type:complete
MLSIQVPQIIPGKENSIMPKPHTYIIKIHIYKSITPGYLNQLISNSFADFLS